MWEMWVILSSSTATCHCYDASGLVWYLHGIFLYLVLCVFLSPVSVGRLYFIAKCSPIDPSNPPSLPVDKYNFIKKQNLQKVYPAETNLILSLAMTSIFVVHIYACSNTIY